MRALRLQIQKVPELLWFACYPRGLRREQGVRENATHSCWHLFVLTMVHINHCASFLTRLPEKLFTSQMRVVVLHTCQLMRHKSQSSSKKVISLQAHLRRRRSPPALLLLLLPLIRIQRRNRRCCLLLLLLCPCCCCRRR